MRHTISITLENEYGMLARVAGSFSARGYQIDTLNVAPTLEDGVSRITLITHGNDHVIEQIVEQTRKMVRILEVQDLTANPHVEREMVMLTINAHPGAQRQEVLSLVEIFRARVVDVSNDAFIVELTGNGEKVNAIDLDEWDTPGKRPDGSPHKLTKLAPKDLPRQGAIGFRDDHGSPIWYKNVKLKVLP